MQKYPNKKINIDATRIRVDVVQFKYSQISSLLLSRYTTTTTTKQLLSRIGLKSWSSECLLAVEQR